MSFFSSFTEHFESGIRKFLPYSLLVFLLLLNAVPIPFVMSGDVKVPLFLMGVYYWSVFRPSFLPPWLAFVAGVIVDLLGGLPLGMNASIYVLVQWIISDQRRFLMGQSFIMIWVGFLIVSIMAGCFGWLVFGLANWMWPPIKPIFFSVMFGGAFFPLVCVALHWTHKILPSQPGSLERS